MIRKLHRRLLGLTAAEYEERQTIKRIRRMVAQYKPGSCDKINRRFIAQTIVPPGYVCEGKRF